MLRSMYSGVSGMRGFQTKLDVIGNNIANVNTIGFKSGRVMFKDIMSQTVSGVTAPGEEGQGGVNAKQIGLGVSIGSIDTLHTGGSAMTTNNPTDLRIEGDGFFLVKLSGDQEIPFLTRAGDFHVDASRNLITSDGLHVVDSGAHPFNSAMMQRDSPSPVTEQLCRRWRTALLNPVFKLVLAKSVIREGLRKLAATCTG